MIFLYRLLGSSAFVGLAVACLFLPLNHIAGKIIFRAQENLMKATDERVALTNEILGAIRMLKVLNFFYFSSWFSTPTVADLASSWHGSATLRSGC